MLTVAVLQLVLKLLIIIEELPIRNLENKRNNHRIEVLPGPIDLSNNH